MFHKEWRHPKRRVESSEVLLLKQLSSWQNLSASLSKPWNLIKTQPGVLMKEGAARVCWGDFGVFAHSACTTVARYLAQHDSDRGRAELVLTELWLCVLPPLCSLGFKDITPSSRPTGHPGKEDTWGKSFEGLGSAGGSRRPRMCPEWHGLRKDVAGPRPPPGMVFGFPTHRRWRLRQSCRRPG